MHVFSWEAEEEEEVGRYIHDLKILELILSSLETNPVLRPSFSSFSSSSATFRAFSQRRISLTFCLFGCSLFSYMLNPTEANSRPTVMNCAYILAWTIFWALVMIWSLLTSTHDPYSEAAHAPVMILYLLLDRPSTNLSFVLKALHLRCSSRASSEEAPDPYMVASKLFDACSAQMAVRTVGGVIQRAVFIDHVSVEGLNFGYRLGRTLKITAEMANPARAPSIPPFIVCELCASISSCVKIFMM